MSKQIQVLQTGNISWEEKYKIPEDISWNFINLEKKAFPEDLQEKLFDVVILEGKLPESQLAYLEKAGRPYTFFITGETEITHEIKEILRNKRARKIKKQDIRRFINLIRFAYYPGQEGTKIGIRDMEIQKPFSHQVKYEGNCWICLDIENETDYRPILFLKYNLPLNLHGERGIELWPEYTAEGDVSLQYKIRLFKRGSAGELLWSRTVSEKEFEKPVPVFKKDPGFLAVQIFARGLGRIKIGSFHYRSSRAGLGQFLPGGQRHSCADRGELLSYFDPGDRKPPLVVYFSGYRTAEGFEGNGIMRGLGMPFLLLGDPRLEGGGFFLGGKDYEKKVLSVIQDTLDDLKFDRSQLIFSGLSMGTFGAVYYGCTLSPHGIVIGKPLMNLGTVAANERRLRPGGFPTSLDVLCMAAGGTGPECVENLNQKLWKKFENADFSDTVFSVAYMHQDDYDSDAYKGILSHLERKGCTIVGKGIEGRHNDNTAGIVNWFMSQLRRILRQDFGREGL
ncbi:MAG: accessory Sec system protein Asp2 [Clostridiales bacterium]|nr:accessory Sec system protein Asp2 [Clostridiales bacterium]